MSKYIYQSICTLGMQLQRNVWGATDMCYGASSSVGAYGYVPVSLRLNQPISIFWGLDNSHSYNSGAVSMHSRNNPQLVLTMNNDPTVHTTIYVVHEVLGILSVDGLSSAVEVSTGL